MAEKHLSRDPIHARRQSLGRRTEEHPNIWWYEERGALILCFSLPRAHGALARIPIAHLRAFIERHDRSSNDT